MPWHWAREICLLSTAVCQYAFSCLKIVCHQWFACYIVDYDVLLVGCSLALGTVLQCDGSM